METEFKRCGEGENACNCKTEKECGYLSQEYEDGMRKAEQELDFESEDNEYSSCENCGSDSRWETCWQCGGEGGQDGEELMEEDPLWYGPDDYRKCDICDGKGGYYVCLDLCGQKK